MIRGATGTLFRLLIAVLVDGCRTTQQANDRQASAEEKATPAAAITTNRLALDPVAAPLSFRWLADDAVLIDQNAPERKLAGFGNYVSRIAQSVSQTRVALWDDEAAWKRAAEGGDDPDQVLAHKRAEYVKDLSPPEPVDRYLVFNREGMVEYQRDFRSWPLTDTDALD
ncbi:MAG: hypothetical protein ACREQQ_07060 [Candidatus Binatia bacterium]